MITFNKNIFYALSKMKLNVKKVFYLQSFLQISGSLKLPNWPCSGLSFARFEDSIHNAEKVTRIVYA